MKGSKQITQIVKVANSEPPPGTGEDIAELLRMVTDEPNTKQGELDETPEKDRNGKKDDDETVKEDGEPGPPVLSPERARRKRLEDTPTTVIEIIPREDWEVRKIKKDFYVQDAAKVFEIIGPASHSPEKRIYTREHKVECQVCGHQGQRSQLSIPSRQTHAQGVHQPTGLPVRDSTPYEDRVSDMPQDCQLVQQHGLSHEAVPLCARVSRAVRNMQQSL